MQQKANIRKDFDQQVVFYSLFREEGINDNFRGASGAACWISTA